MKIFGRVLVKKQEMLDYATLIRPTGFNCLHKGNIPLLQRVKACTIVIIRELTRSSVCTETRLRPLNHGHHPS